MLTGISCSGFYPGKKLLVVFKNENESANRLHLACET